MTNWRATVLAALFFGPIAVYMALGGFLLWQRSWAWSLFLATLSTGAMIAFWILAARWSRSERVLMPPIDWEAPHTFSPEDQQAWDLVHEEANQAETISMEALSTIDAYIDAGKRLALRLSAHYNPLATSPIEHVPVVELLTALELAAEDLNGLCRQVPGGDLITPAFWKKAVVAAGYFQKANNIYSYLLPIFSPMTGLPRLAAQKLMVNPAWKNMQHNLMRWFYRAYVNRLGVHLIELYSKRLVSGAEQYRRLTRKSAGVTKAVEEEMATLTFVVAGARGAGKSLLIEALEEAQEGDLGLVRAQLEQSGFDAQLVDRLKSAMFVEAPGYKVITGEETARNRATRRIAVEASVDADLLLLAVDATREDHTTDVKFVEAWEQWYKQHRGLEMPPVLVVVTGVDKPEMGGDWNPPHDWERGRGLRETAVRARLDTLRAALPANIASTLVVVALGEEQANGVVDQLLPAIVLALPRAERTALIRHLQQKSARSKAGRFISQVGQQGRRLLGQWKPGRDAKQKAS